MPFGAAAEHTRVFDRRMVRRLIVPCRARPTSGIRVPVLAVRLWRSGLSGSANPKGQVASIVHWAGAWATSWPFPIGSTTHGQPAS